MLMDAPDHVNSNIPVFHLTILHYLPFHRREIGEEFTVYLEMMEEWLMDR